MEDGPVTRSPDLDAIGSGHPVADHCDEITTALDVGRAVIVAPPGTGKTTFVPPLVASRCSGRVIVTQPRRVAARSAARRLSTLTRTRPGEFASHTVRGESTTTRDTRVEFVTTG
ncbi:MAG: ATP-dependent helicase HrpB, partial [Cutibacterium avidum]|nr:ATP-dependent helicase HrpB [Cutibacterium avidum]